MTSRVLPRGTEAVMIVRTQQPRKKLMATDSVYGVFKIIALVVLLLMAVAGLYAGYMSVALWSGIGV